MSMRTLQQVQSIACSLPSCCSLSRSGWSLNLSAAGSAIPFRAAHASAASPPHADSWRLHERLSSSNAGAATGRMAIALSSPSSSSSNLVAKTRCSLLHVRHLGVPARGLCQLAQLSARAHPVSMIVPPALAWHRRGLTTLTGRAPSAQSASGASNPAPNSSSDNSNHGSQQTAQAPGISHLVKERRALLATQKRNRRFVLFALGGLALGACVFLGMYAFQDVLMFYLTPSELLERMGTLNDKSSIRLGGLVLEGSVKLPPAAPTVEFIVTDLNADIFVKFNGLLPDLFREGKAVVVEGKFDKNAATFVASNVLAKHDENYMPKEVAEALAKNRENKALLDEARELVEREELLADQRQQEKEHYHSTRR
ncbi:hypothetical protein CAOG_09148 [Capsaspora owczarzaki ATCC 30864]|uniref:Cytochrome c-type biogenesis protein CcmE n=1 Tax=Capsaspora owczarzaki (strain ATCC 30864) TaxID=595528 RepID=A0A0D2X5J7_CAPO3|nr:hypothetical protein CAOG_09148 [Capsaspora owczarzaki ATCC 30864]KJE97929.1 hypothetical protein CAOG_009148 [Capsaspora owczarzaki ATCC 30864]|eukprot:XP_011270861.1 hypothetical protein CAOG_09148 [Capsaspora owczarzaki ATCC 30864]